MVNFRFSFKSSSKFVSWESHIRAIACLYVLSLLKRRTGGDILDFTSTFAASRLTFYIAIRTTPFDTEPLLDICCLKVSSLLMGKSAEEIRSFLNIPKMTPEEEAEAREKHRWIFDD